MSNGSKGFLDRVAAAGISAKTVIIPAVVIVFLLHAMIVANTLHINRLGENISRTMEANFRYAQTLKTYESVSDILSDKARLYASTGDPGYLKSYFEETENLDALAASVRSVALTDPAQPSYDDVTAAQDAAERRASVERRVLRSCADKYEVELTAYPTLLTAEPVPSGTRASSLLADVDYLQSKSDLHDLLDSAVQFSSRHTSESIRQQSAELEEYRTLQWVCTIVIIVILSVMCVLLFLLLLNPLELSVEQIQSGSPLPTDRGLVEFRRLALSYNELQHHRKMMENYLRKQSQTDALTGLPNRLAFQDYIAQLSWKKADSSVTVFSIDVNGLKSVNDNLGHACGDELLRKSALCVRTAFGGADNKRCFRFGGDEFAAFWVDASEAEIADALETFTRTQAEQHISISVGSAHAEHLGDTTAEDLFDEADRNMYAQKAQHYKEMSDVLA